MAKQKKTDENGVETPQENVQSYDVPAGYEEKTTDVVGFWNYELGPIHFIPLYAKAFDNHVEPDKATVIIVGQAVGANRVENNEDEQITTQSGDLIGVWYKPGMMKLKELGGCKVFMQYSGEMKISEEKGRHPMKTFKIATPKDAHGSPIYLQNDYRKKSLHRPLPFEPKPNHRQRQVDDDENFGARGRGRDIPF